MSKPLISVIVPVYKVEHYLERCIKSVLSQGYENYELLLIDDGSPDCCGEICDRWAMKDHRIRVFHKTNGGLSSARNYGIEHASGSYLTFIDSDDWVTSDYLSYLLGLFIDDCAVTACNHTIIRKGKKKNNSDINVDKKIFKRDEAYESVLFHGCLDVSGWGKMYKRSIFESLRYPEGRLFEDTYLFGDVLDKTEYIVFGGKSCYFYEMHENSLINSAFTEKNLQFIDAAEKLAYQAEQANPSNHIGAIRRVNHARLSVLRYMEHCDRKYLELRRDIRTKVLSEAPKYITDIRTPKRDKIAVTLLWLGFKPYYIGWNLYGKLRSSKVWSGLL